MKKLRLRKWVEYTLMSLNMLCIMILSGDCDDFFLFTISKIITLTIFIISNVILYKYTNLFED